MHAQTSLNLPASQGRGRMYPRLMPGVGPAGLCDAQLADTDDLREPGGAQPGEQLDG